MRWFQDPVLTRLCSQDSPGFVQPQVVAVMQGPLRVRCWHFFPSLPHPPFHCSFLPQMPVSTSHSPGTWRQKYIITEEVSILKSLHSHEVRSTNQSLSNRLNSPQVLILIMPNNSANRLCYSHFTNKETIPRTASESLYCFVE